MATHDADFLRSLAETDLMGLLFWDEKGGVTGANDAFLAIVGHTREDLAAGRIDWKRMTPPEFGPLDEKAIAELTYRGACTPFEKEYVGKDGSRVPVLVGGSRVTREPLAGVVFVIDLTDRKRADRELLESRERMSAVLETALDCIITIDGQGTVLEFNPAAEKVFGYPRHAAVGRPMSELIIPPDLREAHRKGLQRFLETGEGPLLGKRVQVRAQRSDGTQFPVELAISVSARDRGLEFTAFLRDISDRERSLEALRESEARFRTLVEHAPEAIVVFDLEMRLFVDCNENAVRLFGYRREELLRMSPLEISPAVQPDGRTDAEFRPKVLGEAMAGKVPVFEWFHRNAKGEDFPCEVRLVKLPGSDRALIRGSIIDITERKRAEQAIRESEERFRQIAETVREVFWINSPDLSGTLYVSPAFDEIWGRSREDLYRSPRAWTDAIHPDDREAVLRTAREQAGRGLMDNTYRIVRPDGSLRWIHDRGFPIRDESGKVVRMVGIAEDVTSLKETEAALRESQRQLEEALRRTQDRVVQLEEQVRGRASFGRFVGKSLPMQEVYRRLRLAAQSDVTVLLTGESGTGKELAARTIHDLGPRKDKPFVAVNCSAIPEPLLESELFGHVKGAFTGAVRDKMGLFESAEGGTLFLDEVGDMPATLQVKVLRALQEREVHRVGDERPIRVSAQLVTATNRDLQALLASGGIREDFFYRICVFEIRLPPLRERKDDIPLLVSALIEELAKAHRKKVRGIAADAMRLLMAHSWPGNVRELRNAIEHAFVTVSGDHLRLEDLPSSVRESPGRSPRAGEDPQVQTIEEALRKTGGHRAKAAKLLGVSRVTLWKRMRRLGMGEGQGR